MVKIFFAKFDANYNPRNPRSPRSPQKGLVMKKSGSLWASDFPSPKTSSKEASACGGQSGCFCPGQELVPSLP